MVELHLGQGLRHLEGHGGTGRVVVGALVGASAGRRERIGDVEVSAHHDVFVRRGTTPVVAHHVELGGVVLVTGDFNEVKTHVPHVERHGFGRCFVGCAAFVDGGFCTPAVVVLAGEHVNGVVGSTSVDQHQLSTVFKRQGGVPRLVTGRHGEVDAVAFRIHHQHRDARGAGWKSEVHVVS